MSCVVHDWKFSAKKKCVNSGIISVISPHGHCVHGIGDDGHRTDVEKS